ncbi:bifunctional 3-deoxy-7-phosphoheptulonate synthase/chorismate mutase type II [candidate division KSB1 bacterium]|nr:bifunctional 3-deoxy-7-phosphoheptulonate synthase/chorismate mutase type II [candidate division KSB1 bacterium]
MSETKPKLKLSQNSEWRKQLTERPFVISGPCSAESEEQLLKTALALKEIPAVRVFRAGIWKPRTRPNSFEGVGVKGLKWLKNVKEKTGLATAVEVANQSHVYEALKFGVDVLWIGARTTANPFSVQEIADALQGIDIPVWVKNPVNPDLQLWIGALERLNNAGIHRLGAIHRGFTTHEKTPYRNAPKWQIPIELKRLVPDIPLICDPSHISGSSQFLQELSQKALDLTMAGLMIETHTNPENALSDAKQQILPSALSELLRNLKMRSNEESMSDDILAGLRRESNAVDYELLEILSRRMDVVRRIGEYKKEHNLAILQVQRWQEVIEDRLETGDMLGLEKKFVKDIYEILHSYAIKLQSAVMNVDQKTEVEVSH